jgi:CelD/BcsL family acetyltransferase involved in cellulose biosynthesis
MTTASPQIAVLRSPEEWDTLRSSWDEILARQSRGIEDLDVSAGFDWAMTVWQTHLDSGQIEILVLREGNHVCGILPLYRFNKSIRRIPCRILAPLTEIFSGRTGFLLHEPRLQYLDALLDHARNRMDRSEAMLFTLVNGSLYQKLFLQWARRNATRLQTLTVERSPYTSLKENWERHFASIPGKLRTKIRSGEKRLRERGELSYREYRSAEEVAEFNQAVREIEAESWKATAGTSIASNPKHEAFHTALTLRAAQRGWFSGHLLLLDKQPIAYVNGLLYNGVFVSLKISHRVAFREMSPGHVLTALQFERLYQHGAHIYDWTGKCEEYKMRWADDTYCRTTYLLFNDTLRGRAAHWLSTIAGASPNVTAPAGAGASESAGRGTPETQADTGDARL